MVYNEWLIQASSYEGRITEEMLCAGAPGKDSCQASISLLLICIHICVFLSSVFVFSFYSYLANCKDRCQAGISFFWPNLHLYLCLYFIRICFFLSSVFVSFFHSYLANCKDSCQASIFLLLTELASIFVSLFHPYLCLSFIRICVFLSFVFGQLQGQLPEKGFAQMSSSHITICTTYCQNENL